MQFLSRQQKIILVVLAAVSFAAMGQLFMKLGMNLLGRIDSLDSLQAILFSLPGHWFGLLWVGAGIGCYGLGLLLWLQLLARVDLSIAYPLASLAYILVYLGAIILPGVDETPTLLRTLGILVIVAGVVLVTPRRPNDSRRQPGRPPSL